MDIGTIFQDASSKKVRTDKFIERYGHIRTLATIRDSKQQTLLHVAAGFDRFKFTKFLIGIGADVNAQDNKGWAPIHNSTFHAHKEITSELIKNGAEVNIQDNNGWAPLLKACARSCNKPKICSDHWEVIKILLNNGANPYLFTKSKKPYFLGIQDPEDRRDIRLLHIEYLLKENEDNHEQGRIDDKIFQIRRINIVDTYLVDKDFFEILINGDEKIELLAKLLTPRTIAMRLASSDKITPLHRAAGYGQLKTAELLIENGARVNATDDSGCIPLHNASKWNHVKMIELLVKKGSNVNARDKEGYTPLHVAANSRSIQAPTRLKALGADLNAKTNNGQLPYQLAELDLTSGEVVSEALRPVTYETCQIPTSHMLSLVNRRSTCTHDSLMIDYKPVGPLMPGMNINFIKIKLDKNDPRYRAIKERMNKTIVSHVTNGSCQYSKYKISRIELIVNEDLWGRYSLKCQSMELYGAKQVNETLLFHGSKLMTNIIQKGFDEGYAKQDGMFGAAIYFAAHSSKSNQYTFGWNQGCETHNDKNCALCDRKMVLAQVALGRSMISPEPLPEQCQKPPGYHSVSGIPGVTENLSYPEYAIYNGDQAYPLYVVKYTIKH